jgi:hypothetical protein
MSEFDGLSAKINTLVDAARLVANTFVMVNAGLKFVSERVAALHTEEVIMAALAGKLMFNF